MSKIDLSGKTAVVTGGGGVLCGAFAKAIGACGARVAVLDLKKEAADKVAAEINAAGGTAMGVAANVLEPESLIEAEKFISKTYGPCDILINGAGGNHPKGTTSKEYLFPEDLEKTTEGLTTFYDLDPQGIGFVFNLNFIGTLLPTQYFTRDMAKKGSGVIINVSSMNAFTPLTKIPAYSGAKAAVSNFTQWLAVHFSRVGIRVNAIAPGFFLTDQNRSLLTNEDGSFTERAEKILGRLPCSVLENPRSFLVPFFIL
jgi:NAD(P)-dependent dehydrogenase (short-subunit alcohol dehydrogenase family)